MKRRRIDVRPASLDERLGGAVAAPFPDSPPGPDHDTVTDVLLNHLKLPARTRFRSDGDPSDHDKARAVDRLLQVHEVAWSDIPILLDPERERPAT